MREPPFDMQAEQSTLGGMLLSRDAVDECGEVLRPDDFYVPKHALIFETIMKMRAVGQPTDVISVADTLISTGELAQAGGADYLHTLTSICTSPVISPFHAAIVSDKAVLRRLGEGATRVLHMVDTQAGEPAELLERARREIDQAAGALKSPLVYVGDLIDEVVADAERPRQVWPSPWPSLDEILGGGFRPGALYVLAARTGIGKTAIALQIANALAKVGPVAFASLEMPREELVRRIISQGVKMPHHLLEQGRPMPLHWKDKIDSWRSGNEQGVIEAPHSVAIDDRSSMMMADVRAFARSVKRPSGRLAGVVFDYLQLMGGSPGVSRQEVVAENARNFKILARELECPVILLSQLNRNPEQRIDKRPQLADLRESGAIEQDADVVMMLYRDPDFQQVPMGQPPLPVPLELNVPKNRHGAPLMTTLYWEGSQMRAYDGRE